MKTIWQGTILDRFIVIEGLDGAGTTTQLNMLSERLLKHGKQCYATCEPTKSPIGEMIRLALRRDLKITPRSLALLFAADRENHLYRTNGIADHLKEGFFVACDRYLFSSLVYQSLDCCIEYVTNLNITFPLPQSLIFIDTPIEQCQQRVSTRRQHELFDDLDLQQNIRQTYQVVLDQFSGYGVKICMVDGSRARTAVAEQIWQHLQL